MLSRLIYTSSRKKSCTDEDIDKILNSAKRNNGKLDITGVLLYSEDKFLQCLEGKYNTIIQLYDNIKEDTRHEDVVMVQLSRAENRLFPSWQMGNRKIDLSNIEYKTEISDEDRKEFEVIFKGEKKESEKVSRILERMF